jgi:lactoylglutathione lyase
MKFTYTGIEVRDMDRSIKFYTEGLGMILEGRGPVPETRGEAANLRSPGSMQILELNWYPRRRYRAGSELDHLGFDVGDGDVEKDIKRLLKMGATRALPTENRPKYIVGFVKDPDGVCVELYRARK